MKENTVNYKRIFSFNDAPYKTGPILYWMHRDQRVNDNWALLYAQQCAKKYNQPLVIVFCLLPNFLNTTIRQYGFMMKGLRQVEQDLIKKNIPFYLLQGDPYEEIPTFVNQHKIGVLITDFDPLKIKKQWKQQINSLIDIPFYEVDAHNICPCRCISNKQEYAARTIRPKIQKGLIEFLTQFPEVEMQKAKWSYAVPKIAWDYLKKSLDVDRDVSEIDWLKSGEVNALKVLENFIKNKLNSYAEIRNFPTFDGVSNLSPYLHFGQISAQRIAIEVQKVKANETSKESFLEELIVRKELADNFCFYNENYDSTDGFAPWAKQTLKEHLKDERQYLYTLEELEEAQTHDDLWNASQLEMVKTGKMHGYMRMYWAKKILEWTKTPEEAMEMAIYLNDKYELDGCDANGYTGIAWSIGGVHDRAWFSREIFGKIRYMSYNGCKSKFDVNAYIDSF